MRFGSHRLAERTGFLIQLVDHQGREGWGEAAPLPGFGSEPVSAMPQALVQAAGVLSDLPGEPDALRELLPALAPFTRSAIETAAADLAAQAAGLPLCCWLDSGAGQRVAVNGLLGPAGDEAVRRLRSGVSDGLRCFKVKGGLAPWPAEHAVLKKLRQAAPGAMLRLDLNGCWTAAQLAERSPGLRSLGLEYVEQPLPASQTERLIQFGNSLELPLAVDESLVAPAARSALLEADIPLTFVIKPSALGGPLTAWQLMGQAAERGLRCVVTHLMDGPIGRTMALQLALALNEPVAHGLGRPPFAAGVDDGPLPVGGVLTRPAVAGLGIRPALGRLERIG